MKSGISRLNKYKSEEYVKIFKDQQGYIEDGELTFDVFIDDYGFCLTYSGTTAPSEKTMLHAMEIVSNIVEIDQIVAENVKLGVNGLSELAIVEVSDTELYILYNGVEANIQWYAYFRKVATSQWKYLGTR